MFKLLRRKLAVKLVLIVVGVVTVTSILLFLYVNKISKEKMYTALYNTIDNTSDLLIKAYSGPLWNLVTNSVNDISRGVLNMPEFFAINVYDTENFFSGYKKDYEDSSFTTFTKKELL